MKFASLPMTFLLEKENKPETESGKVGETVRRGNASEFVSSVSSQAARWTSRQITVEIIVKWLR